MDTKAICEHCYVNNANDVWIRPELSERMRIETEYCFICGDIRAIDINVVDMNGDRVERKFKFKG
jgi:hypothetical protein